MRRFGDGDYLAHIDERIRSIEASGVADHGPDALVADPVLADATVRRLQTMAESTQRLSEGLKDAHPEIPWRDIAAFRNRLTHGYMDIDLGVVADATRGLDALGHLARRELVLQEGWSNDVGLGL